MKKDRNNGNDDDQSDTVNQYCKLSHRMCAQENIQYQAALAVIRVLKEQ